MIRGLLGGFLDFTPKKYHTKRLGVNFRGGQSDVR